MCEREIFSRDRELNRDALRVALALDAGLVDPHLKAHGRTRGEAQLGERHGQRDDLADGDGVAGLHRFALVQDGELRRARPVDVGGLQREPCGLLELHADGKAVPLREVHAQIQRARVAVKMDAAHEPVGAIHRALLAARRVAARSEPLEERGTRPGELRRDAAHGPVVERLEARGGDGHVEFAGRHVAADGVDVLEVLAEELVEERVVLGRKIRAIPPKPVAALRRVDLAQSGVALRGRERAGVDLALEKLARLAEQIPAAVFLLLADPDVEVARNP